MNTIFINNKKYEVPGSWNELTKDQLIKLATILFSGVDKIKARLMILFSLVNIDKNDLDVVNNEHVYDMLMVTDFALEKYTLTKNLIPEISLPGTDKILYGPSDGLSNIVFIEFIKSEKFYLKFLKDQNINDLNGLIATLYRPQRTDMDVTDVRYDGDIRERYNDALTESRSDHLLGIDQHIRHAIFIYYEGCRNLIIKLFPEIFENGEEQKSKVSGMGWVDVLMNLAGTKFGDFESTGYTRLYTILTALKYNHNQALLMDEEIERRKNGRG